MLSCYCLNCRKNTESKNLKVARTNNGRIMLLSNCVGCDSKRLFSTLGIKAPLNKIPLFGPLLC